jgi:hypothetical protein
MSHQFAFDLAYRYPDKAGGITIPVILQFGEFSTSTTAKVDTGCELCLFSNETAQRLGIDVETGASLTMDSLGGPLDAFGHNVIIQTFGLSVESVVYFAKYPGLGRNLLGRQGWLHQLKICLVDYDSTIYLQPYDA